MRTTDLRSAVFVVCMIAAAPIAITNAPKDARADASELDMANARKLFNEGLDARKQNDPAKALEKFEAADALFATPRGRLELGRQRMDMGQLVEAYATLLSVANVKVAPKDETKYAPYRKEAADLAASLEKRIPTIVIALDNVPNGATPVVRVDQALVPLAAIAEPRMVNPGLHTVTGVVEGQPEKSASVEIKEGEGKKVIITFDTVVAPPPPVASTSTSASAASSQPPPPPNPPVTHETSTWSTEKTLAVIAGGVGVVGLGFGIGFGAAASHKANEAKPLCGGSNSSTTCSSAEGASLRHDAIKLANASTVGFVVGAVLVGAGAVLWLTAPRGDDAPKAGLVVGPGSLALTGSF